MLRLAIITILFAALPKISYAANDEAWPWVLFGPRIDSCAQIDGAMRLRLSESLLKASKSTVNLLPSRIWKTYKRQIFSKTGAKQASPTTRIECEAFVAELEAPDLSARLRGAFFLGMLQGAPFDCMLDDAEKGQNFLIEFRKFYERNGLVYPHEMIQAQLARMRAQNRKALNGWDTPHCIDMQRALSSGELDRSVSEEMVRENWVGK